ncbi:hypothetical protein EJD97_022778 [Solanum chilense]|uniref:Uncharacterized protein n=2 Tax=Solanum subgen. Lycopersicon TaxID=49274 RepID=A0A3Q7IWL3_SOLLC|nr:hypothetical protein EJD97_022778 [Solanum chilense]
MEQLWNKLKVVMMGLNELNAYLTSYEHKLAHSRQGLERTQLLLLGSPLCPRLIEEEKQF